MLKTMIVSVFSGVTGIDMNQIEVVQDGETVHKVLCTKAVLTKNVLETLKTENVDKVLLMGSKLYNEKLKQEINNESDVEVVLVDLGGK